MFRIWDFDRHIKKLEVESNKNALSLIIHGAEIKSVFVDSKQMGKKPDMADRQKRIDEMRAVLDMEQAALDEYIRVRKEDLLYDVKAYNLDQVIHTTDMVWLQQGITDTKDFIEVLKEREKITDPSTEEYKSLSSSIVADGAFIKNVIEPLTCGTCQHGNKPEVGGPYDAEKLPLYVEMLINYAVWSKDVALPAMEKRMVVLQDLQKEREQEERDFYLHFDNLIVQEDAKTSIGNRNILAVAKQVWDTFEVDSKEWVDFLKFMKPFAESVRYTAPETKTHCWRRFAAHMEDKYKYHENETLRLIINGKCC